MRSGFLRCAILVVAGVLIAAQAGQAQSSAGAAECDRTCLNGFVDQYLDALVAHEPSRLPVTAMVRFTEDGQHLELGDGFWNTVTDKGTYKLYMDDPQAGQVGFFGTMREAGNPVILALRLKIEKQTISEIETIVVRNGLGPNSPTGAEKLEKLGGPNQVFLDTIPPAERASREDLIKTANMYFSGIQLNDGKGVYPFADDCNRIENGNQTTNNPSLSPMGGPPPDPKGKPTMYSAAWSCKQQFESGLLHFVTRARDRRFVVVDQERGLVLAFVFFDHAAGKTRTFQVPDGRTVTAGPTTPWTWELAEMFKIEKGKIRQIEAVLDRAPYGMGSGWSSWEHAMSDQPQW
jgi:hypothetical protein